MTFTNIIAEEFDKFCAIMGIIFSIILIVYTNLSIKRDIYYFPEIFTLIACMLWLLIRNNSSLIPIQTQSFSLYLLSLSTFFILFTFSILSIYLRPNLYERPLIYFVLTSIMVGIISIEIFLKGIKNSLVLFQILLVGLSISWSQLLLFPSLIGVDPWWHQMFTSNIINTHHIPKGEIYSELPIFHLLIASTSFITGLNYKFATMLSVSFIQTLCTVILVFLLSSFLFNDYKIGLLASLSVIICDNQIYMSYWSIPNGFGTIFILYILYIFLKLKTKSGSIYAILSIFLMVILILTHTIASFFMAIILFVYWFGSSLYSFIESNLDNKKEASFFPKAPISLTYSTLFTLSMLSWWMFVSGHIVVLSELIKWGFSVDMFYNIPNVTILDYLRSIPLPEQIFNSIGMFLFFSLSLIGCFYMISKKYGTHNTFNFAIIGLTPLFLGFISLISASSSIIEHRWWYFAQVFLSIPFAVSLLVISNPLKTNSLKSVLLLFFIIIISFLMIMSPNANVDNHKFSPDSSTTSSLTMSELQAPKKISTVWNGVIKSDSYYAGSQSVTYKFEPFCNEIYQKNSLGLQHNLVLIRKNIIGKPFKFFSSIYRLNYDPRSLLNDSYFSKIYDCQSVEGYLMVKNAR